MAVFYKQGVQGDLQPVAQKGLGQVARFYESRGLDCYVTSIRDGNHSPGSLHYIGLAFDFRSNGVLVSEIKPLLGKNWDVLNSNHGAIHAEYDPK